VNLMLAKTFPHLMEYYARTATANDTFFGGTSGAVRKPTLFNALLR
jgi:hypothetical protein